MNTTLDPRLLKARLAPLAEKLDSRSVVGFHCPGPMPVSHDLDIEGRHFHVRVGRSVLEIRQHMTEAETQSGTLVVLTPLPTTDLGGDVRGRLFRSQLLSIDAWDAVRTLFRARQVDPRLLAQRSLAGYLVAAEPAEGFPPAPGGYLGADTAWRFLLERTLGLPAPVAELRELVAWAAAGDCVRFREAPAALRDAAVEWLEKTHGRLSRLVLACVQDGHAADVLPLGLVCRVLFSELPDGQTERQVAAARLERFTSTAVEPQVGRAWADAAEAMLLDVLESPDATRAPSALQRAEELLDEVRAGSFAWMSDVLPRGFDQRFERFATDLGHVLAGRSRISQVQGDLLEHSRAIHRHLQAERHGARVRRAPMAIRLLRWLATCPASPQARGSLCTEATRWQCDDSFVHRGRTALWGDEPLAALASAYHEILQRSTDLREQHNLAFAEGLRAAMGRPDGLLPIEDVLRQVVVPLARLKEKRVLLLVLDGVSWPIAHELLEDLGRLGWSERVPEQGALPPVVGAFPTVTETCRASLLGGCLQRGDASLEKATFCAHADLRSASGGDAPPVLHHRATVDAMEAWDVTLLSQVSSPRQKVVAVVINAVDDHLARDGQLQFSWRADTIRPLPALLDHAARAGRIVILASDHGHVLELGTSLHSLERSGSTSAGAPSPHPVAQEGRGLYGGERWRPASTGPAEAGEIQLEGERVLAGGGAIVMPWSERIRYAAKKWGYHGGASPQEVVCPLAVLARVGTAIEGWREVPRQVPTWWEDVARVAPAEFEAAQPPGKAKAGARGRRRAEGPGQLTLFRDPPGSTPWMRRLVQSHLWCQQAEAACLHESARPELARFVSVLAQSGGRVPIPAVARALGTPEPAAREMLETVGRVLNADALPVVTLGLDQTTIVLNLEMLEGLFLETDAADAPAPAPRIFNVASVQGGVVRFTLPFEPAPLERAAIEMVARYGRVTEAHLSRELNTRRVAGLMESLLDRLGRAGFTALDKEAEGDDGRIFVFRVEHLARH